MISAVIITYNEAKHITDCIGSCRDIVDEIIIVDAESTDGTVDFAQQDDKKVRTFVKYWSGYGAARNYGAQMAAHDWILVIDADERCSKELVESIEKLKLEKSKVYQFYRKNIYNNEIIKYGFLSPEWKPRLYHREMMAWDNRLVHEQMKTLGKTIEYKKLEGTLFHHAYDSLEHHRTKLERYAQLTATSWQHNDKKVNTSSSVVGPVYHFIRAYFMKLGCLQSPYGWETSKSAYFYNKRKHENYRDLKKKGSK